jgi:hypothetical protein
MALHRDIHWIGRQWAVTGFGMQLIDQKLKGFFDIEAVNLWDDGLIEAMHAKEWLNKADFDKGLAIARKRYPGLSSTVTPPSEEKPLPAPVNGQVAALLQALKPEEPKLQKPDPIGTVSAAAPRAERPLPTPANGHVAALPRAPKPEEPKLQKLDPIVTAPPIAEAKQPAPFRLKIEPVEPPRPAPPDFHVQFTGSAKFVRPWRVRQRR